MVLVGCVLMNQGAIIGLQTQGNMWERVSMIGMKIYVWPSFVGQASG